MFKKKNNEKQYYREYMREYRKVGKGKKDYQRRNEKMTAYRNVMKLRAIHYKGSVCALCQQSFDPVCFDFHHIEPGTKEIAIASILHKPWKKIKQEIDKCIIVCSNCHRILHKEDAYSHLSKEDNGSITLDDIQISFW
jgi:hypothetical protein